MKVGEILNTGEKNKLDKVKAAAPVHESAGVTMVTVNGREIPLADGNEVCHYCDGSGWHTENCKCCDGTGVAANGATCGKCKGTGRYVKKKTVNYPGKTCSKCHGAGQLPSSNHWMRQWHEENDPKTEEVAVG